MVYEYRAFWAIPNAGASVSTFHFEDNAGGDAADIPASIAAFFQSYVNRLPNEVSVSFDSEVTTIDTTTGLLDDVTSVTPAGTVTGSSSLTWAAGSGARTIWGTSRVFQGRRVKGSTFMVPLVVDQYDSNGQIVSAGIAAMQTNAETLISDLAADLVPLCVYSRPKSGSAGITSQVTTASVSPTVATLRGRKY